MAQDTATMDQIHKQNAAKIAVQVASNNAKAAALPPNVGHTEPPLDPNYMQGTSGGVQPNAFMLTRVGN